MAVPNNRVGIRFIKLTTITFDALVHLVIPNLNQDGDFQSSELFVMTLYCNKNVLLNVKNLSQIRWYSFSKKQSESQEMSPTNRLLHQKILRARYTAPQWKLVYNPSPTLPGPEQYGWK